MADVEVIVRQLRELVSDARRATSWDPEMQETTIGDAQEARRLHTRLRAAIERVAPPGSVYAREAETIDGHPSYTAVELTSIVQALQEDFESGAMQSVVELVHAAVFEDFLGLASELADKGYHAPAAVVAGAVLEEHIRKLAEKHAIEETDDRGRPKSVDALSVALVKKAAISEPRRKIIAGWYGQRTEAAHGHFENVIDAEVGRMIEGVRDFVDTHPA